MSKLGVMTLLRCGADTGGLAARPIGVRRSKISERHWEGEVKAALAKIVW